MDPGDFGGISYFGTLAAKQTSEQLVFELNNREADSCVERGEPGLAHGYGETTRAVLLQCTV